MRARAPPFLGQWSESQLCPLVVRGASVRSTAWWASALPPGQWARGLPPPRAHPRGGPLSSLRPCSCTSFCRGPTGGPRSSWGRRVGAESPGGRGWRARLQLVSHPLCLSVLPGFPTLPSSRAPRFVFQCRAAGQRRDVRPHRCHERRVLPGPFPAFRGRPGAAFTGSGTVRALSRPSRRPHHLWGLKRHDVGPNPQPALPQTVYSVLRSAP